MWEAYSPFSKFSEKLIFEGVATYKTDSKLTLLHGTKNVSDTRYQVSLPPWGSQKKERETSSVHTTNSSKKQAIENTDMPSIAPLVWNKTMGRVTKCKGFHQHFLNFGIFECSVHFLFQWRERYICPYDWHSGEGSFVKIRSCENRTLLWSLEGIVSKLIDNTQ